jgi:hypothetical protein
LEEMETLMVAIGNRCFLSQLCHFTLWYSISKEIL